MRVEIDINDLIDNLTCGEKLELVRNIKQALTQNFGFKNEIFEMFELLDDEERQDIIKALSTHYPSVEKCQELHKKLVAHNTQKDKQ